MPGEAVDGHLEASQLDHDVLAASEAVDRDAAERGLARLAGQLRNESDLRRRMLVEPIETSERQMVELRGFVSRAEESLREAGVAMRSFLRSLRGTGLGIGIAMDIDHSRDLARVRGLRLAD